nr:SDR family NAD(P)-dependent oxidoreductase [Flammeovirgaceae bacterium]
WGVIYMTKSFLPHLKSRPTASIINLSSIFGITGFAGHGTYSTTKFAVRGFNENLRQELVNTNVKVMSVHPGGIKTNIIRNSKGGNQNNKNFEAKKFDKMAPTTAEEAARQIIKALQKDKPRLLIGSDAWKIDKIVRLFPGIYEGIIFKDLKKRMKRIMRG